jgi:hypothetical protein
VCWIDASGAYGAGLSSYGQPVATSGRCAVGVSGQEAAYPATMAAEEVSRRARAVALRYVQAALPGLDPQPEAELQCASNRTGFADGDGFGAVQGGAHSSSPIGPVGLVSSVLTSDSFYPHPPSGAKSFCVLIR